MPDTFGFKTPEEIRAEMQASMQKRNQAFWNSAASQSTGAQAGHSLGNIFGGLVKRALDTRAARKEEVNRLLETGNYTEEQAKAEAKLTIRPEMREMRRARLLQETTSEFGAREQDLREQFPQENPVAARVAAMYTVADKLVKNGFTNEAASVRQQALDLFQKEEERVAKLDNLRAGTRNTEVNTLNSALKAMTDSDTFILLNKEDGQAEDWVEVPISDPEEQDRLMKAGYIKAGPGSLVDQLDASSVGTRRAVPAEVVSTIIGNFNMLNGLEVMRAAAPYAGMEGGIPKGFFNSMRAKFGYGPQEVIDAMAVENKMAADIQSIIKGIPSNYDATVFERLIPRLGALAGERLYTTKIDLLERGVREAVELTIGFYEGTNQEFPENIKQAARALGIDVGSVEAWSQDQVDNYEQIFLNHEKKWRKITDEITGTTSEGVVTLPSGQQVTIGQPVRQEQ